jgi:hypothetical protein
VTKSEPSPADQRRVIKRGEFSWLARMLTAEDKSRIQSHLTRQLAFERRSASLKTAQREHVCEVEESESDVE